MGFLDNLKEYFTPKGEAKDEEEYPAPDEGDFIEELPVDTYNDDDHDDNDAEGKGTVPPDDDVLAPAPTKPKRGRK